MALKLLSQVIERSKGQKVKHIPADLSEQEILDCCNSDIKILEVKRLKRRNKEVSCDDIEWISSQSVVLNFEGQVLHKEIYIFKVSTPTQCFNCFHFRHMSKDCKSHIVCIQCGDPKHEGQPCASPTKCINCSRNYRKSIQFTCLVFRENLKINTIMSQAF